MDASYLHARACAPHHGWGCSYPFVLSPNAFTSITHHPDNTSSFPLLKRINQQYYDLLGPPLDSPLYINPRSMQSSSQPPVPVSISNDGIPVFAPYQPLLSNYPQLFTHHHATLYDPTGSLSGRIRHIAEHPSQASPLGRFPYGLPAYVRAPRSHNERNAPQHLGDGLFLHDLGSLQFASFCHVHSPVDGVVAHTAAAPEPDELILAPIHYRVERIHQSYVYPSKCARYLCEIRPSHGDVMSPSMSTSHVRLQFCIHCSDALDDDWIIEPTPYAAWSTVVQRIFLADPHAPLAIRPAALQFDAWERFGLRHHGIVVLLRMALLRMLGSHSSTHEHAQRAHPLLPSSSSQESEQMHTADAKHHPMVQRYLQQCNTSSPLYAIYFYLDS